MFKNAIDEDLVSHFLNQFCVSFIKMSQIVTSTVA